jgi:hypothetical protein
VKITKRVLDNEWRVWVKSLPLSVVRKLGFRPGRGREPCVFFRKVSRTWLSSTFIPNLPEFAAIPSARFIGNALRGGDKRVRETQRASVTLNSTCAVSSTRQIPAFGSGRGSADTRFSYSNRLRPQSRGATPTC